MPASAPAPVLLGRLIGPDANPSESTSAQEVLSGRSPTGPTPADAPSPLGEEIRVVIRAGVIQYFEFAYELCWKFMKRWLGLNAGSAVVDGVSRKELFRLAAEHRLIEETERWFEFHRARNLTSQTYRAETAVEVARSASEFLPAAEALVRALDERND